MEVLLILSSLAILVLSVQGFFHSRSQARALEEQAEAWGTQAEAWGRQEKLHESDTRAWQSLEEELW